LVGFHHYKVALTLALILRDANCSVSAASVDPENVFRKKQTKVIAIILLTQILISLRTKELLQGTKALSAMRMDAE
jgi:hypothetical protein